MIKLDLNELIDTYKAEYEKMYQESGSDSLETFLLEEATKLIGEYDTIISEDGKYLLFSSREYGFSSNEYWNSDAEAYEVSEDTYARYVGLSLFVSENYFI